MAEERNLRMGEIVRRLDRLKKDKKVQEYMRLKDTLEVKLESATLAWARSTVGGHGNIT